MNFEQKIIENYISSKSGNRRFEEVKLCAAVEEWFIYAS